MAHPCLFIVRQLHGDEFEGGNSNILGHQKPDVSLDMLTCGHVGSGRVCWYFVLIKST